MKVINVVDCLLSIVASFLILVLVASLILFVKEVIL